MVSIGTAFELSALPQGFMAERDSYIRDELTQRIWSLQLIYIYVVIIKVTAACNQRLHSQYWLTGHKEKDRM